MHTKTSFDKRTQPWYKAESEDAMRFIEQQLPATEMKTFLYFSELLYRPVVSSLGDQVGKLIDLKIKLGEMFPKVNSVFIRLPRGKKVSCLGWENVNRINGNVIFLKPDGESHFIPAEVNQEEILLRDELLDKQVVDTIGAKIERVNDIHLLIAHQNLHLIHVEIGVRGILRRLGWVRPVDWLTNWLFAYHLQEKLVSWKYIQPLASDAVKKNLKINVDANKLHEIHPSDLADILEELDKENRKRVFKVLDAETAADALQEVEDPKLQVSLLESAPAERASDILEEMDPDAATDLLADMPKDKQEQLIQTLEEPHREKLVELLQFPEGTAGSIMTIDFVTMESKKTVAEALAEIKKADHPLESIAYLYVTDPEGRLLGVLTLRQLLCLPPENPLRQEMNTNLVTVKTDEDVKDVAELFGKYKFMAIPVVDEENRISGIITIHDIVAARESL